MEKGEWIKHMPFLYLQVPDDEIIMLGTTEHGVLLNIITIGRGGEENKKEET